MGENTCLKKKKPKTIHKGLWELKGEAGEVWTGKPGKAAWPRWSLGRSLMGKLVRWSQEGAFQADDMSGGDMQRLGQQVTEANTGSKTAMGQNFWQGCTEDPMAISCWLKFHWPHSHCNLAKKCNCSHVVTFILKWVISKIVWFTTGFDRGEVRWSYYFLRPGRGETKAHFVHLKHWKFQPGFCNSHKLNKKTKHMNIQCSFLQCRKEE